MPPGLEQSYTSNIETWAILLARGAEQRKGKQGPEDGPFTCGGWYHTNLGARVLEHLMSSGAFGGFWLCTLSTGKQNK